MSVPAASHSALHVHSAAAAHWAGQNEPSSRVSCWLGGGAPHICKMVRRQPVFGKGISSGYSFHGGFVCRNLSTPFRCFLVPRKETSREVLFVLDSLSPKGSVIQDKGDFYRFIVSPPVWTHIFDIFDDEMQHQLMPRFMSISWNLDPNRHQLVHSLTHLPLTVISCEYLRSDAKWCFCWTSRVALLDPIIQTWSLNNYQESPNQLHLKSSTNRQSHRSHTKECIYIILSYIYMHHI